MRVRVMLYDATDHVALIDPFEVGPIGDGFAPIEHNGRVYHYESRGDNKSPPLLIFREASGQCAASKPAYG